MRTARFTTARIAVALGYPELEVKRLQRLAGFPTAALEALRRGRINLRTAKLLAQVTDTGTLTTFIQQATAGYLNDYAVANHLRGRPGLDDPCFDLVGGERNRERGGRVEADLFGDFADVILDPDLLRTLWRERTRILAEALRARGFVAFEQDRELYRAPEGYDVASANAVAALADQARSAWDAACAATDTAAQAVAAADRSSDDSDADLVAFLDARLEQELSLHGDRFVAVGLYPVRYMDRARIEVVNGIQERAALRLMGCVIEVANYAPRVFVPIGADSVLGAVIARHPVEEVIRPLMAC